MLESVDLSWDVGALAWVTEPAVLDPVDVGAQMSAPCRC